MAYYLNTKGKPTLGIGICDRCSRKFPLDELVVDGDNPGLRVCRADRDEYDPNRLPPRPAEDIMLPFVRPDVSIATDPAGFITEEGDAFLTDESDEFYLKLI